MLHNDKFITYKSSETLKFVSRLLFTRLFKLFVVAISVVSIVWVGQKLDLFPIRYVKIVGSNSVELNHSLLKTIEPLMQDKSHRINLSILASQLKQWTCVERIVLWPILPYTLIIHLSIREPIAIFQSNENKDSQSIQWIDKTGFLFNESSQAITARLPRLIGPREKSNQLLKQYQELNALLKNQSLQLATVRLDSEGRSSVTLTNGIELLLGHLGSFNQLQQLLDIHPAVLHQANKVEKLDLRYQNGMAIIFRQAIS